MQAGERCSSCWKDASAPDFRRQCSGSSMGGSCFGIRTVVEQQCSCQKQGTFSLARFAFCRDHRDPHGTPRDAKSIDVLLIQLHVMNDTVYCLPAPMFLSLSASAYLYLHSGVLEAYRCKFHMFRSKDWGGSIRVSFACSRTIATPPPPTPHGKSKTTRRVIGLACATQARRGELRLVMQVCKRLERSKPAKRQATVQGSGVCTLHHTGMAQTSGSSEHPGPCLGHQQPLPPNGPTPTP